jgi:Lon protease-like protein
MFPLGSVLFPGGVLPLHVFEPRYRTLVHDCIDSATHEFGVVLIARGSEVGGGDDRTMVGTRARLVEVAEIPDGRYAVVAVGVQRIRVVQWLPDDPYPQALVEPWPDDPVPGDGGDIAVQVAATTARVRRCMALATELGDPVGDSTTPVSDDPGLAAFQLATLAPIGPLDRHQILAAAHVGERLDVLDRVLDDVEALLRFRLDTASQ